ncbi:MAG: type II toxin-antitoxin system HicA family toxin [candidate division WOR-3 bacterium]
MSGKLPQVSGRRIVRLLEKLGYKRERQKGSHMRMSRETSEGTHFITVPMHRVVAKGTLHDILKSVSSVTLISVEELLERL